MLTIIIILYKTIFLDLYIIICLSGLSASDCGMVCLCHILSPHLSRDGHPDCLHLWTTMNSTAIHIIYVSLIDRGVISLG